MKPTRFALAMVLASAALSPLSAQDRGIARLHELVNGLTVTPRVLVIGARPGDADADLIAWLARDRHVETAYLSLSRGESSTNFAGIESGVALGAIHVEEALAARRFDGGEQFFTRAFDFGAARSADEVFRKWNRDSLLGNVVTIVRSFRPHVIIARFTPDVPLDGHRQVSAMMSREVFDAALDTIRFKRAAFGTPWPVAALYELAPGFSVDVGGYDASRGMSLAELAEGSRAQLRTMGFDTPPWESPRSIPLRRVSYRGVATSAPSALFDGVDTSFARLDSAAIPSLRRTLASYKAYADSARASLGMSDASALRAYLARASDLATTVRNAVPTCRHPARDATVSVGPRRVCAPQFMDLDASADLMQARANEAFLIAAGVRFEAIADREFLANRDTALVSIIAHNDGDSAVVVNDVTVSGAVPVRMSEPVIVSAHSRKTIFRQLAHAADAHPWWLWQRKQNFYPEVTTTVDGVPHADLMPSEWGVSGIAVPENIRRITDVVATISLHGTTVTTSVASVAYRSADPVLGVRELAVSGVPSVTLAFERATEWALAGKPLRKQMRVVLRSFSDKPIRIALKAPPASSTARFDSLPPSVEIPARQSAELRVPLKGVLAAGRYEMSVVGSAAPDDYTSGFRTAQYPHLPPIHLYRNSTVNVQAVDLEVPARLNVAYVRGVGEDTDVPLKQLGIPAYVFNDEGLSRFDLADFTTIVLGPGAYETNRGLYMMGPRLTEFVRKGGTLVVMSNPVAAAQQGVLPYPVVFAKPFAERINGDDAPVRAMDVRARLLSWPNVIRDDDWAHWVGARAVSVPTTADARYTPLVEMHDIGEPENRNSILMATLGKGRFIYTSITFPQQISNGVPGAMRLFVNVLSAGMPTEAKLADATP